MQIRPISQFNYNRYNNQVSFRSCIEEPEDLYDFGINPEAKTYKSIIEVIRDKYNNPTLFDEIEDIAFENIDCLETYRRNYMPMPIDKINKGCYRGEALLFTPQRFVELKKRGIKNVIDVSNMPAYDILCDIKGFKYYCFAMFNTSLEKAPFISREEYAKKHKIPNNRLPDDSEEFAYDNTAREYIDKFKEFVSVINQGNFYLCDNFGAGIADTALLMNQYFNPKWDGDKSLKPDLQQLEKFEIFYENLTARDKRDLGFTEEFEKDLCQKFRDKTDIKKVDIYW